MMITSEFLLGGFQIKMNAAPRFHPQHILEAYIANRPRVQNDHENPLMSTPRTGRVNCSNTRELPN